MPDLQATPSPSAAWYRMHWNPGWLLRRTVGSEPRSPGDVTDDAGVAQAFEDGTVYDDSRCIDGEIRRGNDVPKEEMGYSREALDNHGESDA